MKILYIVSSLRSSGTTSQLYNLVSKINDRKFEVNILTLSSENKNSRYNDFIPFTNKILSLNLSRVEAIFSKNKLIDLINEIEPDLIHTHTLRPDIFGALFLNKKYKVCTTIHSHSSEFFKHTYGNFLGSIITKVHIFALKNIKHKFSCSNSVAKHLHDKYKIESKVIYNGVNVKDVDRLDDKLKQNLRIKYGIDENKKVLIYVGSLSELKNVVFLIDSFKKCNLSQICQLIVLGDGEMMQECKTLADSSIILKGNVDNVKEFLYMSDIIVSASQSEGLPMAIIEGMGVGLPSLVSNISAHCEILKGNSEAGVVFENNNFIDFKAKIMELLGSDLQLRGIEAKKLVNSKFTSTIMANCYEREYKKVIENK